MKILVVGDGISINTGLATVQTNLAKQLKRFHDVRTMCTRTLKKFDDNRLGTENIIEYRIGIGRTDKHEDGSKYMNHRAIFNYALVDFEPDIVVTVDDLWRLDYISSFRDLPFVWIAYVPIESYFCPSKIETNNNMIVDIEDIVHTIDLVVPYTKFGMEAIQRIRKQINEPLPHGIDTNMFYQMERNDEHMEIRNAMKCNNDTVVFLSVGANQARKRFDILIKAWRIFMREMHNKTPNAKLYLHTQPIAPFGWDLPTLVKMNYVDDSIYIAKKRYYISGVPDKKMPIIYNSCDVFVLPSACEGWGLPFLEAMACGLPIIYNNFSGPSEFAEGAGIGLESKYTILREGTGYPFGFVDEHELAEAINELYQSEKRRKEYGKTGRNIAKKYDWKIIGNKWNKLIEQKGTTRNYKTIIF